MAPLIHVFIIASLLRACTSYVGLGQGHDATPDYIPRVPVPQPWQFPADLDLRVDEHPAMITAIAPSTTTAANGTIETMYSIHYHDLLVRRKEGRGVFRRGVFADDPPIATCTPCGFQGTVVTPNATKNTSSTASCTISTYEGVFRSVLGAAKRTTQYCYDSSYSGVFVSSSTSTTSLPCCFTVPASCRSNSSMSMSYTYTTGVFRSSTTMQFLSNFTASTSTSSSLSTGSSTSAGMGMSTLAPNQKSSSSSSVISTGLPLSEINSVAVIFSSTITVVVTVSPSSFKPSSAMAPSVTLSVITASPSSQAAVISSIVTTVNNTVEGCGTASGSGEIIGTGTVYIAGGYGVVSSGTVSGSATKVVGCGTLIATTGSFTGSATIIGCGSASGYATLDGSGTIYPAALGGMVGITSSGRVTGSGSVIGCGTIIGTGTFTATGPYTTTICQTLAPQQETVEVYVSYCPTNDAGLGRIAGNLSSPAVVSYYPVISNSTMDSSDATTLDDELDNPLCHVCDNDSGTCCPLSSNCGADGHCPWNALVGSGYVLVGLNVVAAKNSSGSSQKLKR